MRAGGSPTGHFRGPRLIQFRNSSAVRITNLTIQHSAFWTIHFYACRGVSVTDSRIIAGTPPGGIYVQYRENHFYMFNAVLGLNEAHTFHG